MFLNVIQFCHYKSSVKVVHLLDSLGIQAVNCTDIVYHTKAVLFFITLPVFTQARLRLWLSDAYFGNIKWFNQL